MTPDPDSAELLDREYAKLDAMMAGLDAAVEERERAKAEATRRAREIGAQLERVGMLRGSRASRSRRRPPGVSTGSTRTCGLPRSRTR